VLLTRAAYMALSTAEREQLDVTALGAVALRGVPKPVEMYQLDVVPGRTFAALRLDREFVGLDENESENLSGSSALESEILSCKQNPLVPLLTDLFAPLPLQQRLKLLQMIGERWNIVAPSMKSNSPIDVCLYIICRLSEKLGRACRWKAELLRSGVDLDVVSLLGGIANDMGNLQGDNSSAFASSVTSSFQGPFCERSLADRSV
ncbi:receptor-type adenylate cyclase, partial [Trypanosoma theileri]